MANRYFLTGGAGFIGSHFNDHLLGSDEAAAVTVFDNLSSGREWHIAHHLSDRRFHLVRGDVKDLDALTEAMRDHDVVIHLASNPDIARAAVEPSIDFYEGTLLTHNVLEAMRRSGAARILYASGSGVYGDIEETEADEDFGPLIPISTYGASKLAGEALISAYCHMFGLSGCVFRLGNVVGPRQTHGVGLDFVRALTENPFSLRILGDGFQSKSYVYVTDVVQAFMLANRMTEEPFRVYNIATGDYITVREIADLAAECIGLNPKEVVHEYTGGDRGWKGDVPIVRLNTDRMRKLEWVCKRSSKEALRDALVALLNEIRAGHF